MGFSILENGPLPNLGTCLCLGMFTHHLYPAQRSERRNGQTDPKRSVSQETRSKQNSGHQQLGNGGAAGQGVSCPRAREKRLVDPSPRVNHDNREERDSRAWEIK